MRSVNHLLLALAGAFVGLYLAGGHGLLFPALIGACAGLGIAEAAWVARRIEALEAEVARLRTVSTAEDRRDEAASTRTSPVEAFVHAAPIVSPSAPAPVPPAEASQTELPQTELPQTELRIVSVVRRFFTGGNTLVRVGVVVLFFGVAFLLRYLAEHTHVPIEFRLSGVAAGGLVLLGLGWALRRRRAGYALALQGGAVGILYLTVFAAMRLYALLPPATAFPLLVVLAALSATLAVLQNSQAFALLAVTGGFLAPLLASSEAGSHVVLFTYYVILNAVILAVAWFKAWRPLNLAGFLFTFVIATAWGALRYRAEDFPTTEPFLIVFFCFYVAMQVLFALRQAPELRGYVDATLVFGTPIAAFALQSAMLHGRLLALAYTALAMSGLYLVLAWQLHRQRVPAQRLLVEAFLALGIAFLTLAVPLALDGSWSAATWALEGAAMIWIGCRQNRARARGFGALLQIASGCTIALQLDGAGSHPLLPTGISSSSLLVGAAAIFGARILAASRAPLHEYERALTPGLLFWGLIWWCVGGIAALQAHLPAIDVFAAALGFFACTALLCSELHQRLRFGMARVPALLLLPVMLLFAMSAAVTLPHPSVSGGWIAWPAAFVICYWTLWRHEGTSGQWWASALHSGAAWLLAALVSWELAWQVVHAVGAANSWSGIARAVIPALFLLLLPALTVEVSWPFGRHRNTYLMLAGSGFALYLGLWSLLADARMRGDSYPLPYVPVLNPLDLAQLFVMLVLIRHYLTLRRERPAAPLLRGRTLAVALAALGFVGLNAMLLRALHHWGGVPFSLAAMLQSTLVQTALSIFWAMLALTTMLLATRRASRIVWLAGAGLLAIVVVKLFLVDLSRIGTIDRIVSFVGVGLLMLVLGYFSPLPPLPPLPPLAEEPR
jgi:uncharacterized membrane protein